MPDALPKLLIVLASQIPLFGAAYRWWEQVQQHKSVAAALTVGYELLVFVAAFIKTVWTDELKKDAVKFTADWVRSGVKGFAPGFLRRYRRQMSIEHNIFNVRGLGLIDAVTLSLDQVFVDLQITQSSNPGKASLDPVAVRQLENSRSIWDFVNAFRRANAPVALAVIGPPGCGKTTLLQHIAVTLAANRQRRYRSRAYIPVLLSLREHIAKITQEKPLTLAQLAQEYFTDRHPVARLNPPPDWFTRRLDAGKCMVLFDGLDEVADAEQRRLVSAWVDQQIENYPKCPFILTARPQGYRDAPLRRAHVLESLPFNAGQIRQFIDNWYLASEIVSSGYKRDEGVRQRAARGTRELLKALNEKPSLNDLTVNPLLLTMVAMVHRYHGALPGSRIELYAEICQVLLGRWRQAKGVKDKLSAEQKLVVLRPLAAHMMANQTREITTDSANGIIAVPLERVGLNRDEAEKFLSDTQSSSGLLLEREAGRWSFAHLTFQEFLTAAHWLEQKETACDWSAVVNDSWWHETLRLYAAQGDATPLAQACLGMNTITALMLAADCLEEGREIAPEVRCALEERVIAGLDSDNIELRRLAAEVKLSRRLASLRRIDNYRAIDLELLSCAEYQLFLDDMRAQEKYHQPDHWPDHDFAKGQADEPVVGVRAEDAEAFCKWLTRRQRGKVIYRLPHMNEAADGILSKGQTACWCKDETRFSLAGISQADEKGIQQQFVSLCRSIASIWKPHSISAIISNDDGLARAEDLARFGALVFYVDLLLTIFRLIAQIISSVITHARAHYGAFDRTLDRALDLAQALARALDRDHAHARALARALDRALDRDRALDLTFAFAFARARARAHDLDCALDRDLARALALDRDLALARTLAHALDRALVLVRVRALDRALVLAQDLALVRIPDLALTQIISRVFIVIQGCADNLNYAWGRSLDNRLQELLAVELNRLDDTSEKEPALISRLFQALREKLETLPPHVQKSLSDILAFTSANNPFDARHAQRQFAAQMLEIALTSNYAQAQRNKSRWWRSLWQRQADDVEQEQAREFAAQLYLWLQIVIAREEGKLPAWEGIRIVSEVLKE